MSSIRTPRVEGAGYADHPASQLDQSGWFHGLARAESMDLVNDPRFFTGNVLDKRLGAFAKLSMVTAIMLGTSMGQMFALKKDMNFEELVFGWLPMGWIQFIAFILEMIVLFCCLIAVYVMVHQIFYTIRLMTAGATGVEQASMFYLNRTICMWRHIAIKCLLNGLWLFIMSAGILVFVKFYKDAAAKNKGPPKVIVDNASPEYVAYTVTDPPTLDIQIHLIIGSVLLVCFISFGCLLRHIHNQHNSCFKKHYHFAQEVSMPLMEQARGMAHRSGINVDT